MRHEHLASYIAAASLISAPFIGYSAAVQAEMIHAGDMETGNFIQWNTKELPKPHSAAVVPSPIREGGAALMIDLRRGDAPGRERAEVMPDAWDAFPNFVNEFHLGQEYWYTVSVCLSADWVIDNDREVVFQFHSRPDLNRGESWSRQPPLALYINGGEWQLVNRADARKIQRDGTMPQFEQFWSLGPIVPGAWTDWSFQVKWSYGPDGILQVWRDGQPVVSHYGPNTFNDNQGPYLKMGIYKFTWKHRPTLTDRRVIYFDSLRILKGG